MTDQNRINGQCPKCQSPLLYNADKDIFYCECGYTEKVKHNINIITNNNTIYQQSSKSSAENDDEYIYNNIFNKAITYLEQDDEDSFYELENVNHRWGRTRADDCRSGRRKDASDAGLCARIAVQYHSLGHRGSACA